jgi:hypothetical protein
MIAVQFAGPYIKTVTFTASQVQNYDCTAAQRVQNIGAPRIWREA